MSTDAMGAARSSTDAMGAARSSTDAMGAARSSTDAMGAARSSGDARPSAAFGPTPSQTAGPYVAIGFTPLVTEEVVPAGTPGAFLLHGRLTDGAGAPVPDGAIEVWQPDPAGHFAPEAGNGWTGYGRSLTDADGAFRFTTVKPGALTTTDGVTQAPHIEVLVFARGLLRHLRTRIYFPDEAAANAADPVLRAIEDDARRATLVAVPDAGGLRFDVRLQGDGETVFFAP